MTANDPLVDSRVIRALDTNGVVHNLICDANGNLIVTSGGTAAPDAVQVVDGTTPTQKLAVDSSGRLTLVPNQVMVIGDGTTPTQKLAIDSSGRLTILSIANALPAGTNNIGVVSQLPAATAAANVLNGQLTGSASAGAATLITIPLGRTWVGTIGANCVTDNAAANTTLGQAVATFTTAGTGVTPAAGTCFVVRALASAGAVGGLTGSQNSSFGKMPLVVIAPVGNAVTIAVALTVAGTNGAIDAFASGQLI